MKRFWIFDFGFSIERSKSNKVFCLVLGAMLFALCLPAAAQQPTKIPRIGYLAGFGNLNNPGPPIEAFRQGLQELGYVEGKNILIEYRYIEGQQDRVPSFVAEMVQLKVDALVIPHTGAIFEAKRVTKTIPIVIVANVDPVANGIVNSLARPGGNITGLARLTRELGGKRLELLKEAVPKISRLGVLWDRDDEGSADGFKEYQAATGAMKIPLQSLEVRGPNYDLDGAFQAAIKGRDNALIVVRDPSLRRLAKRIADLAIKTRLPYMSEGSDYVEAGGLMSYSTSDSESFKRAATYVDKILKGTKPADLPVEQPTKFEFVINLKTAKALNLTIPQSMLYRADKVIK